MEGWTHKQATSYVTNSTYANMPLPLKLTDSLLTFFKNVFNTNFLSPTSEIFLVALVYSPSVTSSKIFN